MLQPTQESLEITISKIMKNKILLPDFQRQFVWKDEESQCKLIASVLTKMPLGSILLLRAQDASEYACKPLGSRVRLDTSKVQNGQVEFLLDGQQRMTVLANVFSDAIFQLSPQVNNLTAPGALKRRFFLELPKFNNVSDADIFHLKDLQFPFSSDDPDILTTDVLPFIKVVPFNVVKDKDQSFNPYNKKISKMTELESYCMNASPDYYYVPLFLLIETSGLKISYTSLNNILSAIAKSIFTTKVNILKDSFTKNPGFDAKKYVKTNLSKDVYDAYFNEDNYSLLPETVCEEFSKVLKIQADSWMSKMLDYLMSCIRDINLGQIVVEDSQRARAIDIYENLNRGGVSLDIFDLVMARVAQVTTEPFYERLTRYIQGGKNYPDSTINAAPSVRKALQSILNHYHASEALGCYDAERNEIPRAYLESFLNVLCIHCNVPTLDPDKYIVELIKRQKKLALSAVDINNNCHDSCRALDRACFFFQSRCGIRSIKEINYVLMLTVVGTVLYDDQLYNTAPLNEKVFDLLEAWYWISVFSGAYDKDQNQVMINDLRHLVANVLSYQKGENPDLSWLNDRKSRVLDADGFSDKDFLLMGSAENDEYPKSVLHSAICQFYLSKGYEDLRFNALHSPTILTAFSDTARSLQVHHVIPLGATASIAESTKKIRANKAHLLNSPLNMMFRTDEANRAISNMSLGEYSSLLPASAGLGLLGFVDTDLYTSANDQAKSNTLGKRYVLLKQKLMQHINALLSS